MNTNIHPAYRADIDGLRAISVLSVVAFHAFPALIVVLIACFVFGWYALLADEWEVLGRPIGAGALFLSNVLLWDEVDYFDTSADLKPLLHLWSLGVEEQFYLAWPLVLFLAWRSRSAVSTVMLAVLAASFVVNIATVEEHRAAAFYLPLARFWQLLSGGLLAYFTLLKDPTPPGFSRRANNLQS